jgi:hypothetical protein
VAVPKQWVQILAKSAKWLPNYGCGIGGWGGGADLFLCFVQPLLTFHFTGTQNGKLKKEELQGTFDYFSILICDSRLATFYFWKALEPPLTAGHGRTIGKKLFVWYYLAAVS